MNNRIRKALEEVDASSANGNGMVHVPVQIVPQETPTENTMNGNGNGMGYRGDLVPQDQKEALLGNVLDTLKEWKDPLQQSKRDLKGAMGNLSALWDDYQKLPFVRKDPAQQAAIKKAFSVSDITPENVAEVSAAMNETTAMILKVEQTILSPLGITVLLGLLAAPFGIGYYLGKKRAKV